MAGVLAGQVALVTGAGRSGGMGEATARRLAEAGADVVVTDLARDRPELRQDPTHGLGDDLGALEALAAELATATTSGASRPPWTSPTRTRPKLSCNRP